MKTVTIYISLFLSAKSDKAKEKVTCRVGKIINVFFQKENVAIAREKQIFTVELTTNNFWNQIIYEQLQLCQTMGTAWIITGIISRGFSAWTNDSGIIGVNSIGIDVRNPEIEEVYDYEIEEDGEDED